MTTIDFAADRHMSEISCAAPRRAAPGREANGRSVEDHKPSTDTIGKFDLSGAVGSNHKTMSPSPKLDDATRSDNDNPREQILRRISMYATAAWLVLALAACGGGGGGGGGGGTGSNAGGSGGGASITGLIPAPPVLGTTLYADAATLRPFKDAAVWSYRGTATAFTGATPVAYTTATTQSGTTATGTTETMSNPLNEGAPNSQAITLSGGVIGNPQSIDFVGKGQYQSVNFIELRSPVRQGDQYTVFDKRLTDTGLDVDGDGKADALDLAVYVQVVGTETVSLTNLPAMQAVRTDTFVLSRVIYSSNAQASPTVIATVKTWYVAGIGMVRQTSSTPTSNGDVSIDDEQLERWDGITTGLGAMPPVDAVIPATSAVYPGRSLPGGGVSLHAFAFGDHALVLSDGPDFLSSTLASVFDLRGHLTAARLLPGLRAGVGTVVATATGVVHLINIDSTTDYALTRLNASGELIGEVGGITLHLGGSHVLSQVSMPTVAADGNTIWLLWHRFYYDPGNGAVPGDEVILQAFSPDGVAQSPEMLVDTVVPSAMSMVAANGQVSIYWTRPGSPSQAMFGSATVGGVGRVLTLGSFPGDPFMTPLRAGPYTALLWPYSPDPAVSTGTSGGLLLDATSTPVRAGTGWADEQITGLPIYAYYMPPAALGSRIVATTMQYGDLLWPGDTYGVEVDTISWLDVTGAPLAKTPIASVRFAGGNPFQQAVFADRVLVFGGTYQLTTTVVWLNKGTSP